MTAMFADGGMIVWFGGLFLLGLVGFIYLALFSAYRFLAFVFRSISGGDQFPRRAAAPRPGRRGSSACRNSRCGFLNQAHARFCARCGQPLRPIDDVDAYG